MGLINSVFSKEPKKVIEKKEEKQHRLKDERIIKLLLFGPGEVGKTTILRRMMLIYKNDLSGQRKQYRPKLCYNVIEGAYFVIRHSHRLFKLDLTEEGATIKNKVIEYTVEKKDAFYAKVIIQAMIYYNDNAEKTDLNSNSLGPMVQKVPARYEKPHGPMIVTAIRHFYETNPFFQKALEMRHQYSLYENWLYFAEKLKEYPAWGGKDWVPSDEDLLMSRMRTTGMYKFNFKYEDSQFQLIDVGGQRKERQTFFSLFSQVDAVVFVVSLADYDQKCFEDINTYRLTEAIHAWRKAVASEAFKDVWVILMFNKLDLFKKKYFDDKKKIKPRFKTKYPPPKVEEEEGNRDCPKALKWFEDLYLDVVPAEKKHQIRTYCTSALKDEGENSLQSVMNYCVDFLVNKLIETGMSFS